MHIKIKFILFDIEQNLDLYRVKYLIILNDFVFVDESSSRHRNLLDESSCILNVFQFKANIGNKLFFIIFIYLYYNKLLY